MQPPRVLAQWLHSLHSMEWAEQLLTVWSHSKEDHSNVRAQAGPGPVSTPSREEAQHPSCKGSPPLQRGRYAP